ncbi:13806_t:CDS:2 [Dentiscutata heterogama]|uniref:13806_t:CDS:1 n=1 Tax=Dentiscutata heterogama TaxID=1316150 RepID=A0ACA9L4Q0_9GLOM|nr:13806_t:CDS:2 [Dentiscutata heterogama]
MDSCNELNKLQLQGETHNYPKELKSSYYPNDRTQVGLLGSLLVGPALALFAPLLEKESLLLKDFDCFIGEFKTTFGDSDKVRTTATRIRKLTQKSKSASSYTSEFHQISSNHEWGEAALIDQFQIGLKNDVKDLLLTMEDPTSLNNAISKTISFTPELMQIDSTRARTLSEEEKQRQQANNLCLYCGKPGHIAKKLRKRDAPTAVRGLQLDSTCNKGPKQIIPDTLMNTFVIPVSIQLLNKSMLPINALIDSEALVCFLDYTLAHKYNLPINTKSTSLSVEVIDR